MSDMTPTGRVASLGDDPGPAIVEIDWTGAIFGAGEALAALVGSSFDPDTPVRTGLLGRSAYDLLAPAERSTLHNLLLRCGQEPLEAHTTLLVGRRDDGLPLAIQATIPAQAAGPNGTTLVLTRWGGPVAWAGSPTNDAPERTGPDHVLSHDVRATVRNARNFVNLFARKLAAAEPPRPDLPASHLDTALRALGTGDETLDRLVWFTRLERDPLVMQAIPLTTLVELARRQASDDLTELAATDGQGELSASIEVELRLPDTAEGLEVIGNLELLTWLLGEVFTNARKFGGPDATILIEATSTGGFIELRVANTGPPIVADLAEQAFKLGRMLQARGERPGVGLGLPVARRIVTRHGGRMSFAAHPPSSITDAGAESATPAGVGAGGNRSSPQLTTVEITLLGGPTAPAGSSPALSRHEQQGGRVG